jgi:FkbM family methyltransferase
MKEIRTATFKGLPYQYVVHDVDSIKEQPGVERLAGVASHPEGASHATWGTFVDEAEVRDRHWHFEPGDVVLDIGPAFGSYTITAAIQGARVFAFEPCEFCRAILAGNLAVNPEAAKLVTVIPIGVHERAGWFEPNEGKMYDEPGGERLEVCGLDEMVGRIQGLLSVGPVQRMSIAMIKLDVEGAELGAIESGAGVLRIFEPRLLIEEHEFKEKGIGAKCEELLRSYGYAAPPLRVGHGAVNHAFYAAP